MSRGDSPRREASLTPLSPSQAAEQWIIDARVDWQEKYSHPPRMDILVESIQDELLYEKHLVGDDHILYYGESPEGYVNYYVHNPADQSGFGGRLFRFKLYNGTTEVVRGPWSSRAGIVNKLGIGPVVDVAITDDQDRFETGRSLSRAAVTIRAAKCAIDLAEGASHLEQIGRFNNEPYWIPIRGGEGNG